MTDAKAEALAAQIKALPRHKQIIFEIIIYRLCGDNDEARLLMTLFPNFRDEYNQMLENLGREEDKNRLFWPEDFEPYPIPDFMIPLS